MTIRPSASTPHVTGDAWGLPSLRAVITIAWCRVRMKPSNSFRVTTVFVATFLATPAPYLPPTGRCGRGPPARRSPALAAGRHVARDGLHVRDAREDHQRCVSNR